MAQILAILFNSKITNFYDFFNYTNLINITYTIFFLTMSLE